MLASLSLGQRFAKGGRLWSVVKIGEDDVVTLRAVEGDEDTVLLPVMSLLKEKNGWRRVAAE